MVNKIFGKIFMKMNDNVYCKMDQFLSFSRAMKRPPNNTLATRAKHIAKNAITNLQLIMLLGRMATGPFCKNLQMPNEPAKTDIP